MPVSKLLSCFELLYGSTPIKLAGVSCMILLTTRHINALSVSGTYAGAGAGAGDHTIESVSL